MEKTLVIIDMQADFEASNDVRTIDAVLREIQAAKRVGDAIIVVEYRNYCSTHFIIKKELQGYPHVAFTYKHRDDGSDQIFFECERRNFPDTKFKVCGVNRPFCVARTICGLLTHSEECQIELIDDACNQEEHHKQSHFFQSAVESYSHVIDNGLFFDNIKITNPTVMPSVINRSHLGMADDPEINPSFE